MNKYELALVVSAKIEDDARTATVEKAKEYITRAGGTVTEVEEWGKKKLAYDVQKMSEAFYYFIQFGDFLFNLRADNENFAVFLCCKFTYRSDILIRSTVIR